MKKSLLLAAALTAPFLSAPTSFAMDAKGKDVENEGDFSGGNSVIISPAPSGMSPASPESSTSEPTDQPTNLGLGESWNKFPVDKSNNLEGSASLKKSRSLSDLSLFNWGTDSKEASSSTSDGNSSTAWLYQTVYKTGDSATRPAATLPEKPMTLEEWAAQQAEWAAEKEGLKYRIQDLEAKLDAACERAGDTNKPYKSLQDQFTAAQDIAKSKTGILESRLEALNRELADKQKELVQKEKELEGARADYREASGELSKYMAGQGIVPLDQAKSWQDELERLRAERTATAERHEKELQGQMQASAGEFATRLKEETDKQTTNLREALTEAQRRADRLHESAQEQRTQLQQREEELENLQNELERLRGEFNALEGWNAHHENQYKAAQAELEVARANTPAELTAKNKELNEELKQAKGAIEQFSAYKKELLKTSKNQLWATLSGAGLGWAGGKGVSYLVQPKLTRAMDRAINWVNGKTTWTSSRKTKAIWILKHVPGVASTFIELGGAAVGALGGYYGYGTYTRHWQTKPEAKPGAA